MFQLPLIAAGAGAQNVGRKLLKKVVKKEDENLREEIKPIASTLAGGGLTRLTNPIDRSAEVMPTMGGDPLMRYTTAPLATPRYNTGLTRPLEDIPSGDEGKGLRKMAQSDEGAEQVKKFGYNPITRKMSFCGGGSKPYKKK